jgi:hypothetical protein
MKKRMAIHLEAGAADAGADGSRRKPAGTLARAVELARAAGAPCRIVAADGIFPNTEVILSGTDSGLEIVAAPGATPCFYGGRRLTGWRPEGGGSPFWTAEAPGTARGEWDFRALLVNGRLAPRARFPESGAITHASEFPVRWMSTTKGGWERKPTGAELTTLRLVPGSLPAGLSVANAELTLYHSWDESLVGIRQWDRDAGLITFSTPAGHPPGAFGGWKEQARTFVVWNVREGMTRPGQWFLDREREKVVYWPLPGDSPESLGAWAPTARVVLRLNGTAGAPVRNVRLCGLTLGLTTTPLVAGGFGALAFEGALDGIHAPGLRLDRVTVRGAGGQGIRVHKSDGIRCVNGTVCDTGAGGLVLGGADGRLENTLVHHNGRIYPSALGLRLDGSGWRVRHNTFHHAPYSAIAAGGRDLRFERNRFHHVMEELVDGAAIYIYAGKGCLIRGNYTYDLRDEQVHAYYLDEQSEDSVVEGNVAVGVPWPIHNHMAWNCKVRDNVCLSEGAQKVSFHNCDRFFLERNVFVCGGTLEFSSSYTGAARLAKNCLFSRSGQVNWLFHDRLPSLERNGNPVALLPAARGSVIGDPGCRCEDGRITYDNRALAERLGLKPLDVSGAGCEKARGSAPS